MTINQNITFNLVKRKTSYHILILFLIVIILFIWGVNTPPNSFQRLTGVISFIVFVFYFFWYILSRQYILPGGVITFDNDNIIVNDLINETKFNRFEITWSEIRVAGYEGKEVSYRRITTHDGTGNTLEFKHKNEKFTFEFFIKKKNEVQKLISFFDSNDINIKVVDNKTCKVLYKFDKEKKNNEP